MSIRLVDRKSNNRSQFKLRQFNLNNVTKGLELPLVLYLRECNTTDVGTKEKGSLQGSSSGIQRHRGEIVHVRSEAC